MSNLTQHQTILWREMVGCAERYAQTVYIGTSARRGTLLAVSARIDELEKVVRALAESDPIVNNECIYCSACILSADDYHTAD